MTEEILPQSKISITCEPKLSSSYQQQEYVGHETPYLMDEAITFFQELKNIPTPSMQFGYPPTPVNTPHYNFQRLSNYPFSNPNSIGKPFLAPTPTNTPCFLVHNSENLFRIPPAKNYDDRLLNFQDLINPRFLEQKTELSYSIFAEESNTKNNQNLNNPITKEQLHAKNEDSSCFGESPTDQTMSPPLWFEYDYPMSPIRYPANGDEWSDSIVGDIFNLFGHPKRILLHQRQLNPFLEPSSNARKNALKLVVIDPITEVENVSYVDCPRDINLNSSNIDFKALLHRLVAEELKKGMRSPPKYEPNKFVDVSDSESDDDEVPDYHEERKVHGNDAFISGFIDPNQKGILFKIRFNSIEVEGYDRFIKRKDLINKNLIKECDDLCSINFRLVIEIFIDENKAHQSENVLTQYENTIKNPCVESEFSNIPVPPLNQSGNIPRNISILPEISNNTPRNISMLSEISNNIPGTFLIHNQNNFFNSYIPLQNPKNIPETFLIQSANNAITQPIIVSSSSPLGINVIMIFSILLALISVIIAFILCNR